MKDPNCLFCKIAAREEVGEIVWEDGEFVAIKNKFSMAPVHLLVMPKDHVSKAGHFIGSTAADFWSKMMAAVFDVIGQTGLDKTGYKLVLNGAGYNHFDHEHMHVLGGTKEEPAGKT
ncbi:MAG: HIT domain-containing protein [Microgenomates group bacterium]